MNKQFTKLTAIICILLSQIFSLSINAQVTIGKNEDPEKGVLLELKNIDAATDGGANADKGLLLPRVELTALDILTVVTSPTATDKLNHRGTIVYNVTVDEDANLEEGIYRWDGEKWNGFQSTPKVGNAKFTLLESCNNILIAGSYYNDQALSSGNYLRLKVNVTEPGYYNFFAQAEDANDENNGYYFATSGQFMSTGNYEVYLIGAGTPITPSTTGNEDIVYIYSNGTKLETVPNVYCTQSLWIGDSTVRPRYSMVCNSVMVNGIYKQDTALTGSNTITLRINVSSGSQGSAWEIWTDEIEGIRFRGSGILGTAGPQEVILYGEGSCENTAMKSLTIYTNSESNQSTCTAIVTPVLAEKRIVEFAIARGTTYGLASGGDWGPRAMLNDNMNYGDNENSIVKYLGFSNILHVEGAAGGVTPALLKPYTNPDVGDPYDIIIFTYDASPNMAAVDVLVNYVNNGGILIYMDQKNTAEHRSLLSKLFGESVTSTNFVSIGATASYAIKMNSNVNDDIIDGPFGDCRPYQWGDDLANTLGLTFIPRDAIVYAGSVTARTGVISSSNVQVSVMKHKTKNFFWFGDSGFISSGGQNSTSTTADPFKVASATFNGVTYPKYPTHKTHGTTTSLPVCNSTFFANLMAWAIKTAEESGINSGK